MIRNSIIAGFILFVVLALNGITILRVNQRFIDYLNQSLYSQANLCGEHMEKTLLQLTSDINMELAKSDSVIFSNPAKFQESTQSFNILFTKYRDLISQISVYDNNRNFYAIYHESSDNFSKQDEFVVDSYAKPKQKQLTPVEDVKQNGSVLEYHYPYSYEDAVIGNVIVQLNLQKFAKMMFSLYPQSSNRSWQWILNADGQIIVDNFKLDSFQIVELQALTDSINTEASGVIEHAFIDENGKKEKVYTAYYPLSIYLKKMGVMFSAGRGQVFKYYIYNDLLVSILSLLLITGLVIYLLFMLARQMKQEKRLKLSEIVLRQLIEHFPMGILIIDEKDIIRNINSAAQRMLFLGKATDLV